MSESKSYKSLFDEGMKFVNRRVNLDGRVLPKPGVFEKRRLLKGVRLLEQAASQEPTYGAASFMVAKVYDRLGQADESLRWMRKAYANSPNNMIVALELGGALSRHGLNTEAVTILTEVMKLDPNDPRPYSNLGVAFLLSGDIDQSIITFKCLNALEPDHQTNKRLLNLALQVKEGNKARPTTEAELTSSLRFA